MRAISTVTGACLVVLILTACSVIPGVTSSEADSPILSSTPVGELLLTSDDLVAGLGGEWPERFPLDSFPASESLASQIEESRASTVDLLGEECAEAFLSGYLSLYSYKEGAVIGFRDDPEFVSVSIYRMADSDSAAAVVSAFGPGLEVCVAAGEASSDFSLTNEKTSIENAALVHFESTSSEGLAERKVFVNMGSLVIVATSLLSAESADEVVRVQLDKIDALVAIGVTSEPSADSSESPSWTADQIYPGTVGPCSLPNADDLLIELLGTPVHTGGCAYSSGTESNVKIEKIVFPDDLPGDALRRVNAQCDYINDRTDAWSFGDKSCGTVVRDADFYDGYLGLAAVGQSYYRIIVNRVDMLPNPERESYGPLTEAILSRIAAEQ